MAAAAWVSTEGRFQSGTVLAQRYRIVAPLGRGGMGEVYRATDLKLDQPVALKFLPEALSADVRALNRLYNEVRLARQISHPSVCRVYDVAETAGLHFLTMEYVDGEDLRSLLRRIGRVPKEKALEIARSLCAGLAAAHGRGVLHRDLKPANIMIDAQGSVRIMDFGLAVFSDRLEAHHLASGTPAYMAPEQLAREQVTVRSDIYSLGLVLFEIFEGRYAFNSLKRETRTAALSLSAALDPEIERAVLHCLEPDPSARPQSATAVAAELSGRGDALAAAMAAGETPAPELVAGAGATEGLPKTVAAAWLAGVVAGLIVFALLTPRVTFLNRLPVERLDALERVARDTLVRLGIHEPGKHQATGFDYDIGALRRHFDPASLYFWYRTSPYWMVPRALTAVVTMADPPGDLPGMITTKWDGTGRLLYLRSVPPAAVSAVTVPDLWGQLFHAAGLQLERFEPSEVGWIPAPGWDARASWTGLYPDADHTPVRVEAASWRGQPVYFEIMSKSDVSQREPASIAFDRLLAMQLAVFIAVFSISAPLAWRNIHRGTSDREGGLRIAVFVFVTEFLIWACRAHHVFDVTEFTLLFFTVLLSGFLTLLFWAVYMAFEPHVRRRWPYAIISWSRILAGAFRDPLVGGDVLIGVGFGVTFVVLITGYLAVARTYGFRLPSLWMLAGARGTVAYALQALLPAVTHCLTLLLLTFLFRLFFRSAWLALLAIIPIAYIFEPPSPLTPGTHLLIVIAVVSALTYILLHHGLVAVTATAYTVSLLIPLPLTADFSAPPTAASIFIICGLFALAVFGFHSTLAGRPLLKLDL